MVSEDRRLSRKKDRKSSRWYKLDNAAKIIPSSAKGADTRVFRITCELKEKVNPEILQDALDEVITEYPMFNCVLKKGFFWYYLEEGGLHAKVEEDHLPACSPIYYPGRTNLLYRLNYYECRINLEMFHVLSDGTGAFMFFRRLVTRYLEMVHGAEDIKDTGESSSVEEKKDDAFSQYYEKETGLKQLNTLKSVKAYQISGNKDENLLPHLIEGVVSAKKIVSLAKEAGSTVGVYTTALYIQAVLDTMSMRDKKRPIVISVPVNLRQYFKSDTSRNFFGVIRIVYYPKDYDGTLSSIIDTVKKEYEEQLEQTNIMKTMNSYNSLEHNIAIKMVPVWIKDLAISYFNNGAKKGTTTTLSNLGKITLRDDLARYVDRFSAFMAAPSQQVCISSFGDKMVFGEVSPYDTHEVMFHFFRRLTQLGARVEVATNDHDAKVDKPDNGREKKNKKEKNVSQEEDG